MRAIPLPQPSRATCQQVDALTIPKALAERRNHEVSLYALCWWRVSEELAGPFGERNSSVIRRCSTVQEWQQVAAVVVSRAGARVLHELVRQFAATIPIHDDSDDQDELCFLKVDRCKYDDAGQLYINLGHAVTSFIICIQIHIYIYM